MVLCVAGNLAVGLEEMGSEGIMLSPKEGSPGEDRKICYGVPYVAIILPWRGRESNCYVFVRNSVVHSWCWLAELLVAHVGLFWERGLE